MAISEKELLEAGFSNRDVDTLLERLWGLRANGTKTYVKEIIHCLN